MGKNNVMYRNKKMATHLPHRLEHPGCVPSMTLSQLQHCFIFSLDALLTDVLLMVTAVNSLSQVLLAAASLLPLLHTCIRLFGLSLSTWVLETVTVEYFLWGTLHRLGPVTAVLEWHELEPPVVMTRMPSSVDTLEDSWFLDNTTITGECSVCASWF